MEFKLQFRKLGRLKGQRWIFVVVLVAVMHLLFQSFLLPYGKAIRSLLPENGAAKDDLERGIWTVHSSAKSVMVRNPLTVNASDLIDTSARGESEEEVGNFDVGGELGSGDEANGSERVEDVSPALEENGVRNTLRDNRDSFVDDSFLIENAGDLDEILTLTSVKGKDSDSSIDEEAGIDRQDFALAEFMESNIQVFKDSVLVETVSTSSGKSDGGLYIPLQPSQLASSAVSSINATFSTTSTSSKSSSLASVTQLSDPVPVISESNSSIASFTGPKKMRCNMPPLAVTTFEEMNSILVRHRAKSRSMRPRWSSARDQEILAVKVQIEHAPLATNDRELYAPIFRNISMFKKSYELMERTLKVYVYKEGEKPIFHQPILKGLYASEGWFMKLMEGNRRFVVKDPRKAHLFYMPFSSRMLQHILYVRNSHNRTNLRRYLKDYSEKIAAKYSYWNRTGGADHFLVACHDWAPYETRHHMERCMKALCNADVTVGFKIGRDVSLPETYVRSARNPLRDLGGKPPSQRHILAFYAGNLHGYLRPILLQHWKDKDPDMKIFGPMPPGVASKMNYIQHMKSSKYCLCPKGYEVNSPRVVEAVFYECVPVIISDNFVPPFFDALNWEAFSVVVAEKDIPKLKDILLSIPKAKYLAMQLAVRKAQKHFLWHAKPLKYDLFHMTLHSIWHNRVFQIKAR